MPAADADVAAPMRKLCSNSESGYGQLETVFGVRNVPSLKVNSGACGGARLLAMKRLIALTGHVSVVVAPM